MRQKFIAALAVAVVSVTTACTPGPIVSIPSASSSVGATPLTVAIPEVPDGAIPSEGALLANVYAAALNAAGVAASVAPEPVTSGGLVSGLESRTFDIVPAYSREALAEVSAESGQTDPSQVLQALKEALPADVAQLDASKVDDRGNIVVTAVTAERYQLSSIADAAKLCDRFAMGGTTDFKVGSPGLSELAKDYKCVPKSYAPLQPTLDPGDESILWALLKDDVQLAFINSSSPAIADNALVVLTDPKEVFQSQSVVPLVSEDRVDSDVKDVINKVSAVLNTEELANLNRLSQDRNYAGLPEVAKAWLIQIGLVKASS